MAHFLNLLFAKMEPIKTLFPLINYQTYNTQTIFEYKQYQIPFPYQPYEVQKTFMSTLIDALDSNKNALLESPTGTGKTLCLLSSVLTWLSRKQLSKPSEKIKIIYASRTHGQLRQVIKELKNTCFVPKIVTASSRDHSCVNIQLAQYSGHLKQIQCRKRIKGQIVTCDYANIKQAVYQYSYSAMPILDLQQMKKLGISQKFCPFLFARSQEYLDEVDLVLMPYNYIMDRNVVPIYQRILENSIVIIDEAHNIQNVAMDGTSMILKMNMVSLAIQEVDSVRKKFRLGMGAGRLSDIDFDYIVRFLHRLKQGLQKQLNSFHRSDVDGKMFSKCQITNFFKRVINFSQGQKQFASSLEMFTKLASTLMVEMNEEYLWQFDKTAGYVMLLHQIITKKDMLAFYRLYMRKSQQLGEFELWCIDPCLAFKKLDQLGVKNVILASGTLSPLSSWQSELKVPFQTRLSNNHVINNNQVMLNIVLNGPNKERFLFNFANRQNQKLNQGICQAIIKLIQVIPNGVVVFFPSSAVMESVMISMRKYDYLNKLMSLKHFYSEPKGDSNFQQMLKQYKTNAFTSKGAVLFAVCRSRVSEGIDLSDELCRGVIFVGVPYPPVKDPKIVEKKDYQDQLSRQTQNRTPNQTGINFNDHINGQQWYTQQTIRAVNQALGRAIRHKNDYGAIFLMDCRYESTSSLKKDLPKWALNTTKLWNDFSSLTNETRTFFKTNKQLDEKARPAICQQDLDDNSTGKKKMPIFSLKRQQKPTSLKRTSNNSDKVFQTMEQMTSKMGSTAEQKRKKSNKGNKSLNDYYQVKK